MHSMEVVVGGETYTVFHNGDFSGNVVIEIDEVGYDIPFAVLKAVVGKYMVDELIRRLEDLDLAGW